MMCGKVDLVLVCPDEHLQWITGLLLEADRTFASFRSDKGFSDELLRSTLSRADMLLVIIGLSQDVENAVFDIAAEVFAGRKIIRCIPATADRTELLAALLTERSTDGAQDQGVPHDYHRGREAYLTSRK